MDKVISSHQDERSEVVVQPFLFLFEQPRHGFSVRLPRAPTLVSRRSIANWPGIGACDRSEFSVAPVGTGDVDFYLEVYAVIDDGHFVDDAEASRWLSALANSLGDEPAQPDAQWVKGAALVTDPEGLTLVVAVTDAILVLNFDAVSDVAAIAEAFFCSLLMTHGR